MCDQGPALLVNDRVYTRVTRRAGARIIDECKSDLRRPRAPRPCTRRRRADSHDHGQQQEDAAHVRQRSSRAPGLRGGARRRAAPTSSARSRASQPARPRRRGLPDRHEVEPGGGRPGAGRRREVRRVQRRRRRARARSRTACSCSDYADLVFEGMTIARARHRRDEGHPLPARRIRLPAAAPRAGARDGGARTGCSGPTSAASPASPSTSRSAWARAPTSAARKRRSSNRSKDTAASRATGRRSRSTPASWASRPSSTTSRRWRRWPHPGEGRGLVQGDRHREVDRLQAVQRVGRLRRAGRLRVPARASPSPNCSRRSAARAPRRCRSAARRALRAGVGVRPAHRVRGHRDRRLDHRVRAGPRHAARREELHGVLRRGVVRPVHAVPGRQRQAARGHRDARARRRARSAYLQELLALCETMQLASKCGLGQSSPNAFVSIVKHFQDEILGRTAAGATERRPDSGIRTAVEVNDER